MSPRTWAPAIDGPSPSVSKTGETAVSRSPAGSGNGSLKSPVRNREVRASIALPVLASRVILDSDGRPFGRTKAPPPERSFIETSLQYKPASGVPPSSATSGGAKLKKLLPLLLRIPPTSRRRLLGGNDRNGKSSLTFPLPVASEMWASFQPVGNPCRTSRSLNPRHSTVAHSSSRGQESSL